jgi:hypothetical protein
VLIAAPKQLNISYIKIDIMATDSTASALVRTGQNEVKDWMNQYAPTLNPAFGQPPSLAEQRASPPKVKALE